MAQGSVSTSSGASPPSSSAPSVATLIVLNIPSFFGSADLRRFFTDFVETKRFLLFHYKRRPFDRFVPEIVSREWFKTEVSGNYANVVFKGTNVAFVKILEKDEDTFLNNYRSKLWMDKNETELPTKCVIIRKDNLVAKEIMGPQPSISPYGNVGTPSSHLKQAINDCKMPSKLIGKLGLNVRQKGLKYANVPPPIEAENVTGRSLASSRISDDLGEEWERHNSLNDDVSARRQLHDPDHYDNQPGTKERLFEDDMEVTWEKGGSGLVFYTDAQFWHNQLEQDERNTDDWDVDTSVYYEAGAGDLDSKDMKDMRDSDKLRDGHHESAFSRPEKKYTGNQYTRRIMKKQGWEKGKGLGAHESGIKAPIDSRGQVGRAGLGYKETEEPTWKNKRRKV